MAYKNFFYRFTISLLLISFYFISLYNKNILFLFVTFLYLIIFYETFTNFKKNLKFITIYLMISYSSFVVFYVKYFDYNLLNILVFSIILFDSFSYLTGILFGKIYIFKTLSPNKTLEGYLGGISLTNIIFITYYNFDNPDIDFKNLFILVNLIIFFSILGDLIQSNFKRKNNIKDSSNLLPGHGGFFDRFDSFISVIILIFIYSYINS